MTTELVAFLAAAGFGAVIGLERQAGKHDESVVFGARTFALYGMWGAAAAFLGDHRSVRYPLLRHAAEACRTDQGLPTPPTRRRSGKDVSVSDYQDRSHNQRSYPALSLSPSYGASLGLFPVRGVEPGTSNSYSDKIKAGGTGSMRAPVPTHRSPQVATS